MVRRDPPAPQPRLLWPDLAKGVCILLVVLHHTITKQYVEVLPAAVAPVGAAWSVVTQGLKPIRMPLFFVISGLFASSALLRPWPLVTRRATSPYYLYVVWLLVLGLVFAFERSLPMNRTQDPGEFVLDLLFASTGLWFLYALSVYFVIAKLLVRVPTAWVVTGAGALALSTSALPIDEVNRISVLFHLVYFVVGARAPQLVRRVADLRRPALLPALTSAYLGVSLLLLAAPLPRSVDLVLVSLIGVPAAILLAVRVSSWTRVAAPLARIGQHTLPIYVLHMPVLAALLHLPTWPGPRHGSVALAVAIAYPLVITGLIAGVSLLAHAMLVRSGAGFLFELPRGGARSARARSTLGGIRSSHAGTCQALSPSSAGTTGIRVPS